MYTLSCLHTAYEFFTHEWIYFIYGEQEKTWFKSLKDWIDRCYFFMFDSINLKNDNIICSKINCQFLIFMIITSIGVCFTAYKVMKILLSLKLKKSVMEFQWCRNENSNKMSSAFHENNNESPAEDFTLGTSLTAIVKPTIRTNETSDTIKVKDDQRSSQSESSSKSGLPENIFEDLDSIENEDVEQPLVKCTSSLYVVTSKDSLSAEFRTEFNTKNEKSQGNDNRKYMKIIDKVNNNSTFAVQESNSVFEVDDFISTVYEDTISHYQYSISTCTSPDTPALHRNSTYVSGHFVEKLPDLDLSPIQNISPNNEDLDQSLKTEWTNEGLQEKESNVPRQESDHQKYLSESGRRFNNHKYLSSPLSCSSKNSSKSTERFLTFFDFHTYSTDQKMSDRVISKIPRLNFAVEFEEVASKFSKLNTGSKIPIPRRKSPTSYDHAEEKLNKSLEKPDSIQVEQKNSPSFKNKGTEIVNHLALKESEESLKRFMKLEVATGCYSASDLMHHQFPLTKS